MPRCLASPTPGPTHSHIQASNFPLTKQKLALLTRSNIQTQQYKAAPLPATQGMQCSRRDYDGSHLMIQVCIAIHLLLAVWPGAQRMIQLLHRRSSGAAWYQTSSGIAAQQAPTLGLDSSTGHTSSCLSSSRGGWAPKGSRSGKFTSSTTSTMCLLTGGPNLHFQHDLSPVFVIRLTDPGLEVATCLCKA